MVIRIMREVEAESVLQLRQRAIEEYPEYFSSTVEEAASLEPIGARLCSEDDFYLGAFEETQLIGIIRFERSKYVKLRHQAIVGSMFIIPSMRRKGVGRALMLELITMARQREVEQLTLEVGSSNQNAYRLYESLNFVKYGTAPRAIKACGCYSDEDLMILYLS